MAKLIILNIRERRDVKGDIDGLYGRAPGDLQRLVRKIADAPNYDFAMMEFLDGIDEEWRT